MNKYSKDFNLFRKDRGISGTAIHQYGNMMNNKYGNVIKGPIMGHINPYVIEERSMNITQLDIFSRLMLDRIVFLGTGIDDTVSNIITAQLLFLQSIDPSKPIDLYINSGGGEIYSGNSIVDTMNFIKPDVNTLVTGIAASMAYVISISGVKRSCLKHSRLMQHQPLGGTHGQSSDIEIGTKQIVLLRNELYQIISERTGHPIEEVTEHCNRDYWMTAKEAKDYGAIDYIVGED